MAQTLSDRSSKHAMTKRQANSRACAVGADSQASARDNARSMHRCKVCGEERQQLGGGDPAGRGCLWGPRHPDGEGAKQAGEQVPAQKQ